jgi:hypothetical protein
VEHHGNALDSSCPCRPSKTPSSDRLTARHIIERISPLREKQNQQKKKDVQFVVRRQEEGRKLLTGAKIVNWDCALRTASKYAIQKQIF